jgi:hypothetical protein
MSPLSITSYDAGVETDRAGHAGRSITTGAVCFRGCNRRYNWRSDVRACLPDAV